MTEADVVARTPFPRTRESLAKELRALGLGPGDTVLVHASLSALGWVAGGAVAVIWALVDVLTSEGTLVMPAFTGEYSEPSQWRNPPVPAAWWPVIRGAMPAFDPFRTPTRGVGQVAETFRTWPGVLRSCHPAVSFAAWGKQALLVTRDHPRSFPLGEGSPLGILYRLDSRVLLLGVDYSRNSCFHLAESRVFQSTVACGAPVMSQGRREWVVYEDVAGDARSFSAIGEAFEAGGQVVTGRVGSATARLFSLAKAVDFAAGFLTRRC
ncbi:MAG: AAC(3) family N-acetyltransferase [Bacillota bacterium]